MLSLYSRNKEDSESTKPSLPPSRASKTPDRARKLYTRRDSMKQDILTKNHPIVKQTRHKTSTWPSLQHKLWLDISNFPLHQLRENKLMRNEGKDIQRLRGGRPLTVMCSSYTSTVDHTHRATIASTLPSRIGPNTLVSYLRQRDIDDNPEDKLLKLKTLVRNPSREGSSRLRPLQLKKPPVLSDVTPPASPPALLTHCLSCKTIYF